MTNQEKREAIIAAIKADPSLSSRAIARLTGTGISTVGKIRTLIGENHEQRFEASGRRARGQKSKLSYYEEKLPDGSGVVYRCYDKTGQLLYVGASITFMQRLATHSKSPWFHEIDQITLTHFSDKNIAFYAERLAIQQEKPKYNAILYNSSANNLAAIQKTLTKITRKPSPPLRAMKKTGIVGQTPGLIKRPTGRVLV